MTSLTGIKGNKTLSYAGKKPLVLFVCLQKCSLLSEWRKKRKKKKNWKKKLWKIWSWYFALLGKSFCIYQSWQGNKMPEILSVCCAWRQIIAEAIVPHAANKNTVVHKLKSYEKRRVQQLTSILLLLSFVCTSWPYWRAYQELVLHRHHVYCQGISTKWQITAFGVQGAEK